jgi:hypothetical protein
LFSSRKHQGFWSAQTPIFKKLQNVLGIPRASISFEFVRCVLLRFVRYVPLLNWVSRSDKARINPKIWLLHVQNHGNGSHRDFSSPPPPILLSLKSKFEYLSFAHFIDFVLGVQIIFIGGNFNVAVHLFGQICRDALKITIHPFSLNFKTMLMSWAIKICLVLYFMNIF